MSFDLDKRTVMFEGLNCVTDKTSPAYKAFTKMSQAEISWASNSSYALYTVYFGVAVIFAATVKHLWYRQRDYYYKKSGWSVPGSSFVDVLVSYSRYLGYKRVPYMMTKIFSLPHSVGALLFMILTSAYLFGYSLVPHFWYRGCGGFGSPPIAIRAGLMATALTPFIYVLAGKSNMISFLTGIGYEKLNVYHQYIGLAAFVLGLIHTIPFIVQEMKEGSSSTVLAMFRDDLFWRSGIAPLVLLGWLCIASHRWVRSKIYEGFLHLHWLAGIAYFGTLVWHIDKMLSADDYMWGALGFWASQILYRILVKTAFRPNSLFMRPRKAVLHKLGDNAYQVTISNTKGLKWTPGQHCFLRFAGGRFLDNHPFSIGSMIDDETSEMKFIIIPRQGLTKKLYDEFDAKITNEKQCFVDGPYGGTSRDPTSFERVILMSTGSGVTATLPFLLTLVNNFKKCKETGEKMVTQGVNFVWIVRHEDSIDWIRDELEKCKKITGDFISIDIYTADQAQEEEVAQDSAEKAEKLQSSAEGSLDEVSDAIKRFESNSSSNSSFNIHDIKPSVSKILQSLKSQLGRRTMIVSSGSDSMKSEVCAKVSNFQPYIFNNDANKSSIEEIYLHTESFGW